MVLQAEMAQRLALDLDRVAAQAEGGSGQQQVEAGHQHVGGAGAGEVAVAVSDLAGGDVVEEGRQAAVHPVAQVAAEVPGALARVKGLELNSGDVRLRLRRIRRHDGARRRGEERERQCP